MPKGKIPVPEHQQDHHEEHQYQPLEYEINIYLGKGDGAQKAIATVNINEQFAIRGIKIMEGSKGIFVSMPSYRAGNGEYKDICFPCTKESRADFDKAVISAYEQKLTQNQTADNEVEQQHEQEEQNDQGEQNEQGVQQIMPSL